MSRGFPSMTALLGLLAIAGYQNRDKLAEMINGGGAAGGLSGRNPAGQGSGMGGGMATGMGNTPSGGGASGGMGGLGGLLGGLTGAGAGGLLSGGLGELVDSFRQNGHGEVAESWVGTGPNKPVEPPQLERAIGKDVLDHLTQQTGLPREELLSRLSRELPEAVDRYTPEGRIPSHG